MEKEEIIILTPTHQKIFKEKNRVKAVSMFIWNAERPGKVFFSILGVLLHIPGIIYHEFWHLFFGVILRTKFKFDKKDSYFLKPEKDPIEGLILKRYKVSFNFSGTEAWKLRIVAIAPLIGMLFYGLVIGFLGTMSVVKGMNPYGLWTAGLMIYMVINPQTFLMSSGDWEAFKHCNELIQKNKEETSS